MDFLFCIAVMPVGRLLTILGADLPQKIKDPTTPTFFPYRSRYFIGYDYACTASDLEEITSRCTGWT